MKRKQNGLLAGKIANLCVYEVNGEQIVRSRSCHRKSNAQQKQNQQIFAQRIAWAMNLKYSLLNRIWKEVHFPVGGNPLNHFLKINNRAFGGTAEIRFPELLTVSEGKLEPASSLRVVLNENQLTFSWSFIKEPYSQPNDLLNIVLLKEKNELKIIRTTILRSEEKAIYPIEKEDLHGKEGYVFWSSANDRNFSCSLYWRI